MCVTCATCGREWCNEEKGYHCLRAALAARDAELATLRARLAEVERERDEARITEGKLRSVLVLNRATIERRTAARDAALSDVARLTRERDEARGKALEEAAQHVEACTAPSVKAESRINARTLVAFIVEELRALAAKGD